jgi:hypothetical protein
LQQKADIWYNIMVEFVFVLALNAQIKKEVAFATSFLYL